MLEVDDLLKMARNEAVKESSSLYGLYRRYDGRYVVVLGVVRNANDGDTLIRFCFVDCWGVEYCMRHTEFISSKYNVRHFEDGAEWVEVRPIKENPDNVTGQNVCFMRIKDFENFGKNLSTAELVEELRRRKDNPLCDLDVEGLNERVFCREWVLGIPHEEGNFMGRRVSKGIEVHETYDDLQSAINGLVENQIAHRRDREKVYRVVYIEEEV